MGTGGICSHGGTRSLQYFSILTPGSKQVGTFILEGTAQRVWGWRRWWAADFPIKTSNQYTLSSISQIPVSKTHLKTHTSDAAVRPCGKLLTLIPSSHLPVFLFLSGPGLGLGARVP